MRVCGQSRRPSLSSSAAARGEGGNWGHHQCAWGCRSATAAAIWRALADCGEDRKPCRYSKWVVWGMVWSGAGAVGWVSLKSDVGVAVEAGAGQLALNWLAWPALASPALKCPDSSIFRHE